MGRLVNSAKQKGIGWLAELQSWGPLGVGLVGSAEPLCFVRQSHKAGRSAYSGTLCKTSRTSAL